MLGFVGVLILDGCVGISRWCCLGGLVVACVLLFASCEPFVMCLLARLSVACRGLGVVGGFGVCWFVIAVS